MRAALLDDLDDAVIGFRAATQQSAYRQRLLAEVDVGGGSMASHRVLRSVLRLSQQNCPSIRDVAVDLGVEHSTASRWVDALVRARLLGRTRSATDQRQAELQLTGRGRDVLDAVTEKRREILGSVVQSWGTADLLLLTDLLNRLREDFNAEFAQDG